MIIDLIVGSLIGVLDWIVSLLPDASNLGLSAAGGWFMGFATLNTYLPLAELVGAAVLLVSIEAALFTFRAVSWARQQVPFL